jgi:hypothetical protein
MAALWSAGGAARVASLALLAIIAVAHSGQDSSWLKHHQFNNPIRYEGLLDEPNAKLEYDVLGFFGFREKFVNYGEQLHAEYFAVTTQPVFIQAREISSETNYLMEAKSEPKQAGGWQDFAWPVDSVIRKSEIKPEYLGVVARVGSENGPEQELAPVLFFSKEAPEFPVTRYELILRIERNSLTELKYEVTVGKQPAKACYYAVSHDCSRTPAGVQGAIEAGTPVSILFAIDDRSYPVEASIHLEGRYLNSSDKLSATYRFQHHPTEH